MIRSNRAITLTKNSASTLSGRLSVPTELMQHLANGMIFQVEINDEGILYRPLVGQVESAVELPEWAKPSTNGRKKKS